jgi:hypothetical protein
MLDTHARRFERIRVIAGRMRALDWSQLDDVQFRLAETAEDLERAYRLVHDVYVDTGILAPQPLGLHVRPHYLLPTTWTFVAHHRGRVVAEVSVVSDSPLGLPMETTHAAVVERLRQRGPGLVECSGLVCAPDYREGGLIFALLGVLHAVLRRLGVPTMVMRVRPRAAPFYRDLFGCELVGEPASDDSLLGKPLVAIALEVARCEPSVREGFAGGVSDGAIGPRVIFELGPALLAWPDSFTSPARIAALAAIVERYPEILAREPREAQRVVHGALAPHLAWPTGSLPSLPALAWPPAWPVDRPR